jgi:hypothetical protein
MAKRVVFTDQAKAELRAIPQPVAIQILRTLARFLGSQEGNVNRLQGFDPLSTHKTTDWSSVTSARISSKSPESAIPKRFSAKPRARITSNIGDAAARGSREF